MNIQDKVLGVEQEFAIGEPVRRSEDPKLVRGEGRYTDDLSFPGEAHAVMIRSRHAHGILRGIDAEDARAMPGVLGVYTAVDLAAYGPLKCALPFKNRDGSPMRRTERAALAADKVRFVGDPVGFVVAETAAQARDAAEAVVLDIDPLPAVTVAREAAKPGAPRLYDDVPDNVALDYQYGDAEKVARAFAAAAHITRLQLVNSRLVVNAMEPRAAIGIYDSAREHWTLHAGTQGVFGIKQQLLDILGAPAGKVRVLTGHVGGSFGMKIAVYPEYICVLHAARVLGRPVRWTADRFESFLSDHHGRDHEFTGELAFDAKGRILALRLTGFGNMGAFLGTVAPIIPTLNIVRNTPSVYRVPLLEVATRCMFTNTTFVSAYRGAGRPESNYFVERLLDAAAAEMGMDRARLRRLNQVRAKQMPFKAASGMIYDSGDFPALFDAARLAADVAGFKRRKRASAKRGKLRGLGIGNFLEVTAPPSKEMGGIRFEADGTVTIVTGTLDYGQGHAAPFAQVLSDRLGIPFDRIRLLQGDSDELLAGGGTGGSRSMYASGAAIVEASAKVIEKGRMIAGAVLEAAACDIEFTRGRFVVAGTDHSIGIMELAEKLRSGVALPADMPATLNVSHVTETLPSVFPNGCHIAEVEIDPETGMVEVVRYDSVNDFGTVINPMLVEGQVQGGVVQGIGQALMEITRYDGDGQLLTGSFMDYALPRAADVPRIGASNRPVVAKTNPLGVKGCGEAGCAGALSSVMNAINDALADCGIRHFDMPATPERVWRAIRDARTKTA